MLSGSLRAINTPCRGFEDRENMLSLELKEICGLGRRGNRRRKGRLAPGIQGRQEAFINFYERGLCKDDGSLDDTLKFPYIARPIIFRQTIQ